MREFNCTVILVHHTGVSADAQKRARGSSAWKGALDIEINIEPGKKGEPSKLHQVKSKDSELQASKLFNLESIKIDGWFDEDDEAVTTAVYKEGVKVEKGGNQDHLDKFLGAWKYAGSHLEDGKKFVSKVDIREYLINTEMMSDKSAKQYMKPSAKGKFINMLLSSKQIEEKGEHYIMCRGGNLSSFSNLGHK